MDHHILIVEDDRTHRHITHEILEDLGFEVTITDNGYSALDKIENHPQKYNLVILDWEMPKMNGLETVRKIRAQQIENRWPHIPVIAFTANKNNGDHEQCLAAGMDDYLPKEIFLPKWKNLLNAKIHEWIKNPNER